MTVLHLETQRHLLAHSGKAQKIDKEHCTFFELNDHPDIDRFVLWSTYKAYMRGIFIKLYSKIKKQRMQQIEEMLSQTDQLEKVNKQSPSHTIGNELLDWRQKLHSFLLYKFETNLKLSKVNFYALGKKANALLAHLVKAQGTKCKIASLLHLTTKQLLTNPQDIANAF